MKKVIIVEDDPLMARIYARVFTYGGYDVKIAGDGEEGLTLIRENEPDVAILDVMMPKMNGLDLLAKIKADIATAKTKVVMLTNLNNQEEIANAYRMGAAKYLVKSEQDPHKVLEEVNEILR